MSTKLAAQNYQMVNSKAPVADTSAGSPNSDVMSLAKGATAMTIYYTGANATGNTVITVESCDDVSPTTTTAIAFRVTKYETSGSDVPSTATAVVASTGFTTVTVANVFYVIEVDSDMLSGTDKYFQIAQAEATGGAVVGGCFTIIGPGRYQESTTDTAIT